MHFDTINWAQTLVALALGILVAACFWGAGHWADVRTQRRWDRELNEGYAPADVVDLPRQHEADES